MCKTFSAESAMFIKLKVFAFRKYKDISNSTTYKSLNYYFKSF